MFEVIRPEPPDPILGLMQTCREDRNPDKVDLAVGVYKDEHGETSILDSVKQAEHVIWEQEISKSYVGPVGDPGFNKEIQSLVFGDAHSALASQRISTVQTPGGCAAIRVAADFVKACQPDVRIWVSDPTWSNHYHLFNAAGIQIKEYPYYDYNAHCIRFDEMYETLNGTRKGDLWLLHACCHNPVGADLSPDQWQILAQLASERGVIPLIDLAYQGFAHGIEEDVYGIRLMAEVVPELIVAMSCSKSFALYRERVGAAMVVTKDTQQMLNATSLLSTIIRGNYSMPPSHGAAVVRTICENTQLKLKWLSELQVMRDRINQLRALLSRKLAERCGHEYFAFIEQETGMFSYLGISTEQVQRLRQDYSIYLLDSSRISIPGINKDNIDYITEAIASVM